MKKTVHEFYALPGRFSPEKTMKIRHTRVFSAGIQGHRENAEKRAVWIPAGAGMTESNAAYSRHARAGGRPGASRKCRETGSLDSRWRGNDGRKRGLEPSCPRRRDVSFSVWVKI
ncbi:MAG: hypothetical protein LBU39_10805 [Desulfobulbaceae bacterium]|nr:hypothetical protein [Desulfobulbaceae bacterium]